MWRRHFKRLHTHLAAKHGVTVEEFKRRFGLPWTRGLTSAASLANSGWTEERKAKARKVAQKSQFFRLAHLTARRELALFLKTQAIENLGVNAKAFGEKFDLRARALADKGLSIRAIARVLKVAHTTVLERTTRWQRKVRDSKGVARMGGHR
jgi:predicted ATPase with chaperone activity